MLTINDEQLNSFENSQQMEYCEQLLLHLRESCGKQLPALYDNNCIEQVREIVEYVKSLGVNETTAVVQMCAMGFTFGLPALMSREVLDFFQQPGVDSNFKAKLYFELVMETMRFNSGVCTR